MSRSGLSEIDALHAKYSNIDAALPDILIVGESSKGKYHRQDAHADEPHAMCRNTGDWVVVKKAHARVLCNGPCTYCFEAVFDEFAQRDDSQVEYRDSEVDIDAVEATLREQLADHRDDLGVDDPPRLTARPTTVLNAGGSNVYHAPTEHGPYCGTPGDFSEMPYNAVAGHYEPCGYCFDTDALTEPEPATPAVGDD